MNKTKQALIKALREVHAPALMIEKAESGVYDDYETTLAYPKHELIGDAREAGLRGFIERIMDGEFDNTYEEGNEWFQFQDPHNFLSGIERESPFKEI